MAKKDIKTYDETFEKKLAAYEVTDCDGNTVTINTKNPGKHTSDHPLEQWSPIFYNLGYILKHPHEVRRSKSKNPTAIRNMKKGRIKIFIRNNFISEIDLPGHSTDKDETHVIVLYDKNRKKNYSLSYSIFSK